MGERHDWIMATIGLEVHRAAEHAEQPELAERFAGHDHDDTDWIELWWWDSDDVRGIDRYQVIPRNTGNRPGHDVERGGIPDDYVPDGRLPDDDWVLQLVVYPRGTSPDQRELSGVIGCETRRQVEQAIDHSLGIHRWGPT